MTDKKSSESRRKLLKSIAAGSGAVVAGKSLPESWTTPVVDSVMLPAHAQTSPAETPPADDTPTVSGGSSGDVGVAQLDNNPESMLAKFVDALIEPANANGFRWYFRWTICIKPTNDPTIFTVEVMYRDWTADQSVYLGLDAPIPVDLAVGETKTNATGKFCSGKFDFVVDSIKLDSYSSGSGSVSVTGLDISRTINFGPTGCSLDPPICIGAPS